VAYTFSQGYIGNQGRTIQPDALLLLNHPFGAVIMKNILVPTDFSAESHHAYAVALQLAARTGGQITLLHVLENAKRLLKPTAGAGLAATPELPAEENNTPSVGDSSLLEAAQRQLQDFKTKANPLAAHIPVADTVATGRIGEGILNAIAHHNIDLVVMGAQGHGAAQRILVGSNTARLIRLATCPVLTVKNAPQADFAVRTIIFPSDFTEEMPIGGGGLRRVQAAFPDAALHLLNVRKNADSGAMLQRIRSFAERTGLRNVHTGVINTGSPAAGIAQYAQQVGADLVVIPTHARTGLTGFLKTSIAETVATHAFPPVLTYHLVRLSH
jgi:nucleotide-binding universal stress UspA family protein